jgi:hypothetical protein
MVRLPNAYGSEWYRPFRQTTLRENEALGYQTFLESCGGHAERLAKRISPGVRLQEEPFSNPVLFAQLQLFRAAYENGVRMKLSGQGGDTMFTTSADELLRAFLAHLRRGHGGMQRHC